jgi:hypothetical protein
MKQVLYITAQEIRDRTSLDSNVSDDKINNTMILVQDMILEPLLGSIMLDVINDQVIADTLEDKYKTLLDHHVRKLLLSAVQHKIVTVLIYRFNNTGTSKSDIDKEQILSVKEIKELRSEMSEYIGTYGERLTKFLRANLDTYPLYDDTSEGGTDATTINKGLGFYTGDY